MKLVLMQSPQTQSFFFTEVVIANSMALYCGSLSGMYSDNTASADTRLISKRTNSSLRARIWAEVFSWSNRMSIRLLSHDDMDNIQERFEFRFDRHQFEFLAIKSATTYTRHRVERVDFAEDGFGLVFRE